MDGGKCYLCLHAVVVFLCWVALNDFYFLIILCFFLKKFLFATQSSFW